MHLQDAGTQNNKIGCHIKFDTPPLDDCITVIHPTYPAISSADTSDSRSEMGKNELRSIKRNTHLRGFSLNDNRPWRTLMETKVIGYILIAH